MHTIREWDVLLKNCGEPVVYADFVDICNEWEVEPTEEWSTYDLLSNIIEWRGGIASASEVRDLTWAIYGFDLSEL